MIVEPSLEALRDLEDIGDYIARDNPVRALGLVEEIRAKCLDLARTAHAFPLMPRYETLGVRRRVYRNYLIFYRADTNKVVVLHILHGAMDYEAILFSE